MMLIHPSEILQEKAVNTFVLSCLSCNMFRFVQVYVSNKLISSDLQTFTPWIIFAELI